MPVVIFDPREVTSRTHSSGASFHQRMQDYRSVGIIDRSLVLRSERAVLHVQSSFWEARAGRRSDVVPDAAPSMVATAA